MQFSSLTFIALSALSCVAGKAVISSQVSNQLSNGGSLPILIQLTPANVPQIKSNSRALTNEDLDLHADAVFSTLTRHSEKTKISVQQLLEDAKKSGQIKGYRFYSISNTFAVEASKQLIEKISELSEVEEISSNKRINGEIFGLGEAEATIAADLVWTGKEVHWSLKYINATNLPLLVPAAASLLRYGNADTGVDYTHPILNKNYLGNKLGGKLDHNYAWWDANKYVNATNPNAICGIDSQKPCDDSGHGTHTMGTTVGALNLGVSPTSKWMACKNMDQGFGSPESYLGCLQFFLAPTNLYGTNPRPHLRPHVVGNSYGCPGAEGCSRSTFKYALRAMKSAGIFMSVSAGNSGRAGCATILSPPALDPNSFSVAATQYLSNERTSFSSMGPVEERPTLAIDVAAPGANITSAYLNGTYRALQGTSMASPHISGVALLVQAACPHLLRRVDLIAKVIRDSATPVYATNGCGGDTNTTLPNNEYGYGIVNVAKALKLCKKTWF